MLAFQALVCLGALAITASLPEPGALKIPLMLLGMLGLMPLLAARFRSGTHLLPALLLFTFLYVRLTPGPGQHAAALTLLACASAFLLGISRIPLAGVKLLIPLVLACTARGALDLFTLTHLGGEAPLGHAITSFFGDKHAAGGVLVLGAFLHFHLMEKGGPHKPVQVLLYTSSVITLLAMVLSDSRVAQGAFLLCLLPLLFLTLRLDGREPAPERLAWIAGITLCLGLAWINLPELHHRRVAEVFSPSHPGGIHVGWTAAIGIVEDTPLAGSGVGAFRYASVGHLGGWTDPGEPGALPVLAHARNHWLQAAAEAGLFAVSLEAFLLLIALLGMAIVYFRETTLQAKYAFFSLAALGLMGLFTSVLDTAPLNVAYWGLLGYGWSFAAQAMPRWLMPHRKRAGILNGGGGGGESPRGPLGDPRGRDRLAGTATALVLAILAGWHLFQRAKEIQSLRIFGEAQSLAQSSPRRSTDLLAESLAWDGRNVEANYSYARVLAFFRRGEEALKRVEYVQGLAPDWRFEAQALGDIYMSLGRPDLAAAEAARLLAVHPYLLQALELRVEALRTAGRCEALDSFRVGAASLASVYAMPRSRDYTIQSLDSLFMADRDINFLQRWFAGPSLRRTFVERKLMAYNRGFQHHSRARFLREARCPEPSPPDRGEEAPEGFAPSQTPAGLTPEGEPEPLRWDAPRPPKPAAPKKPGKRRRHKNLA